MRVHGYLNSPGNVLFLKLGDRDISICIYDLYLHIFINYFSKIKASVLAFLQFCNGT